LFLRCERRARRQVWEPITLNVVVNVPVRLQSASKLQRVYRHYPIVFYYALSKIMFNALHCMQNSKIQITDVYHCVLQYMVCFTTRSRHRPTSEFLSSSAKAPRNPYYRGLAVRPIGAPVLRDCLFTTRGKKVNHSAAVLATQHAVEHTK